jgi:hypothetical protein
MFEEENKKKLARLDEDLAKLQVLFEKTSRNYTNQL